MSLGFRRLHTAELSPATARSPSIEWGIVTPEYPPKHGGVSDYTAQVARALVAAGDNATVWFPSAIQADANGTHLRLRPLRRGFGFGGRRALARGLDSLPPDARILVQFAPHGFGYRGLNLPIARLLGKLTSHPLDVMFHEVAFPSLARTPLRHRILSNVQFRMARTVAERADRIFVSTCDWGRLLENSRSETTTITWLPVPSNLPMNIPRNEADAARSRFATTDHVLIGHFSTFGSGVSSYLRLAIPHLLASDSRRVCVLMGRGAETARVELMSRVPALAPRLKAADDLAAIDVARLIAGCDAMLQPYPDGISGRRGTAMAVIALGVPMITTSGRLTETLWEESGGVALSNAAMPAELAMVAERTLDDQEQLRALGERGQTLYRNHFAIEHTVRGLREDT